MKTNRKNIKSKKSDVLKKTAINNCFKNIKIILHLQFEKTSFQTKNSYINYMKNNLIQVFDKIKDKPKSNKKIEEIAKKYSKIEKLKNDKLVLDERLDNLIKIVVPQTSEMLGYLRTTKEDIILNLIEKFKSKSFTLNQKEIIENLINIEYDDLKKFDLVTEEFFKKMSDFYELCTEMLSPNPDAERKEMRGDMIDMINNQFGLNLDLNEEDYQNLTEEEFEQLLKKSVNEQMHNDFEEMNQKEKAEKVEQTDIDFQKLYKKLAKLIHPDLAKNEEEKVEKEALMKELTSAWENRDYYELMMIWFAVDPENKLEIEFDENNQKKLIKFLNEKINELEYQIWFSKNKDQRTAYYYQNFYALSKKTINNKIFKFNSYIEQIINDTAIRNEEYAVDSNLKKELKALKFWI